MWNSLGMGELAAGRPAVKKRRIDVHDRRQPHEIADLLPLRPLGYPVRRGIRDGEITSSISAGSPLGCRAS